MLTRVRRAMARGRSSGPQLERGIEAGQLMCPSRGLVDVEECFICPRFRGLHDDHLTCVSAGPVAAIAMVGRAVR